MSWTGKSVALLTGMIVAAVYVILLVGFETYVVRDNRAASASVAAACAEASKQICDVERPGCMPVASSAREPSCVVSVRVLRQLIEQHINPAAPELDAAEADGDGD
jgi:hypothetical protein